MTRRPIPFIERVRIENFKSIESCDVTLGPLTVRRGLATLGELLRSDQLRPDTGADGRSPSEGG